MLVEKTPIRQALFWDKVNKLPGEDACWLWTGAKNGEGYGWITVHVDKKQRFYFVHKVSFEWENGDIPEGMMIRHTCDTPLCVRPSHLIPGTHKQNMQDMVDRGRHVGNRDIDGETAVAIRIKRDAGQTAKSLGLEYGLTPQHISNICTGVYWPDAGGPLTRRFEISDHTIYSVLSDIRMMSQKAAAVKNRISFGAVQQIAQGRRVPRELPPDPSMFVDV